jgi:hypothetical protein
MSITAIGSRILIPTSFFLLTLASGVWLSRSGRPLNTPIFTIHKLIALAAAVLTAIAVYGLFSKAEIQAVTLALIIAAGLGVLTLFVSGALLSRGNSADDAILTIHKVAPLVMATALATTVCLL